MKRMFAPVALVIAAAVSIATAGVKEKPDALIKRGAPLGDSPTITLAHIKGEPDKYAGKSVIVEGVVSAVCQTKGCWMELILDPEEAGVRVTFKDYGFFVPMDCYGMKVRAEGVFEVTTHTKDDADHLEAEGATISRNEDGTATELSFVASGVELSKWKSEKTPEEASGS